MTTRRLFIGSLLALTGAKTSKASAVNTRREQQVQEFKRRTATDENLFFVELSVYAKGNRYMQALEVHNQNMKVLGLQHRRRAEFIPQNIETVCRKTLRKLGFLK